MPGDGWLVLCGNRPTFGRANPHLAENLLRHVDLSYPGLIVSSGVITAAESEFAEDLDVLLNSQLEAHTLRAAGRLRDLGAGIIALLGGDPVTWLTSLAPEGLAGMLADSLRRGALILAAGASAGCFGSLAWIGAGGDLLPGLGWLPRSLVIPGEDLPPDGSDPGREFLQSQPDHYVIALAEDAVLGLGPEGQVEIWSRIAPGVTLGQGWKGP
jgi:hypothetical protein